MKQYPNKQWLFADAPNTAVYTTRDIVEKGMPILIVTHDGDDGAWQFHTESTTSAIDARIATLDEIVFHDPGVVALSDLPMGWMAIRASNASPWVLRPIPSNITTQQLTTCDDGQSLRVIPSVLLPAA